VGEEYSLTIVVSIHETKLYKIPITLRHPHRSIFLFFIYFFKKNNYTKV
jgi:hypothetical protein